jgi:hypothetical protein
MFVVVVMGTPVHWGRSGKVMPTWLGVVFVSSICTYGLKAIWTGVTLADMREFYFTLRHPTLLFRHSRSQNLVSLFDKDKPVE